jgi:precorrin-2 dehydrogenase/sirohydrochlorin ferrochelatase
MFPVALNLKAIPIILAGRGELLEKRCALLAEYDAAQVRVFSDEPSAALEKIPGFVHGLPSADDMMQAAVILVAGLPRPQAEKLASQARALGKLVNVEDVNDLCDFYFTANIRRGDLVIAVSTSGASPTLARKVRDRIAELFGNEWAERVRELSALRLSMKSKGASMREIMDTTEAYLSEKGWLSGKDKAA